jgi:NitT/TauT family transport system substrate-binding protein
MMTLPHSVPPIKPMVEIMTKPRSAISGNRRWFARGVRSSLIAVLVACLPPVSPAVSQAQDNKLENPDVTIGISITDSTFLPIYLADDAGLFRAEGLNVKLLTFRGGSDLTRAVVARSVQIGVASPTSVLNAITAGQNLKVFFGGFNQAPFSWYAVPSIKTMAQAKGKRFGISRFGSATDALTRFALRRAGLDPQQDAKIIQAGGSPAELAAMDTGQLDVGVFSLPNSLIAADRGYNLLVRQSDFMPDFPVQSFFAAQDYLDRNPHTVEAVLRAFIRGVALAKADKPLAVKVLASRAELPQQYAARAYDELIDGWREDGRLATDQGMKKFFDMAIASGDVEMPWPKEKYWDNRFMATIDQWKPQ